MDQELLRKLKLKLEKIEARNLKKLESIQKTVSVSTEKTYYLIWKYILKNAEKNSFKIVVNSIKVKNCKFLEYYTLKIDNVVRRVFLARSSLSKLCDLLKTDGLQVDIRYFDNKQELVIVTSKFTLNELVKNEEKLKNKSKTLSLAPDDINKNGNN